MSEYIEIEPELSDDGAEMIIYTNLPLATAGDELYESAAALEEGSPVAQALAMIDGIVYLRLETNDLIVRRDPDISWHNIVADISAALKDFFL